MTKHALARLPRRARSQHGAVAVEFALVMLPLLLIVFGIIQYGLYFYSAQTGTAVTRDALRLVSVGDCPLDSQVTTYVRSHLGSASAGGLVVTRTFKDASNAASGTPVVGGSVNLHVEYQPMNLHFPFVPFPSDPKVVRNVDARMEDDQAEGTCS